MNRMISTVLLEVQTTPPWAPADLAEVLVNYFQGIGATATQDPDNPDRWQLGGPNNYWLCDLGGGKWRVDLRHGWPEEHVDALGLLIGERYRIRIVDKT